MLKNIKELIKNAVKKALYFGVDEEIYKPIRKETALNFLCMIFMLPVMLLMGNLILAIRNRKKLLFVYDLRACTYRFDFVNALALAVAVAESKQKQLDLVVYDNPKSRRKDAYWINNGNARHYLTNIVFEIVELFPAVHNISYCDSFIYLLQSRASYLLSPTVPFFYSVVRPSGMYDLFYLAKHYCELGHQRSIAPSVTFNHKLKQWLDAHKITKYITVTVRSKSEENSAWNTCNFVDHILELVFLIKMAVPGCGVVVVPDFSNPYVRDSHIDGVICPEAALSSRFRAALYAASLFNIISTNGPGAVLLNMRSRAIYFDIENRMSHIKAISNYLNRDETQMFVDLQLYQRRKDEIQNWILSSLRVDREMNV